MYYIRNTKTDESYDPYEMKFFPNNWEPDWVDDRLELVKILDSNPEKFKDCVIEKK